MLKTTIEKNKSILIINKQTFAQWSEFNFNEKYFTLLNLFIFDFNYSIVDNNSRNNISDIFVVQNEISKNKRINAIAGGNWFFESSKYKILWQMHSLFGIVDIADDKNTSKWTMKTIEITEFGEYALELFDYYREGILYNSLDFSIIDEEDENEDDEDFNYPIFGSLVPNLEKTFDTEEEEEDKEVEVKTGKFIFKIIIGKAWRKIQIDSRYDLDELCREILDAFDFDYDHLYGVTYRNNYGEKITYNGAPDIDYAEEPTTEDILIGELKIEKGSKLEFVYDYGDNWEFNLIVEDITIFDEKQDYIESKVIATKGEAPEQYAGNW